MTPHYRGFIFLFYNTKQNSDAMKTVGIIGGMGPETTARFYLDVIFKSFQKDKSQRPSILIWNVPLKYQIEKELIEKATGEEKYLPYLIEAAKNLESGGADFLVIPCNTVHIFINEIRRSVKIPVLSILEETENFLKTKRFKRIGLLATRLSLRQKLYEKSIENLGIEVIKPSENDQSRIGRIITRLVTMRYAKHEKTALLKIILKLVKQDTDAIILACTDLQLVIKPKEMPLPVFDTMDLLVDATVREILKHT